MFVKRIHILGYTQLHTSYTPWDNKAAWIKALYNRATKICRNPKLLDEQTRKNASFMSWNGFLNYVSKPLLGSFKSNSTIPSSNNSIVKNDINEIIFSLSYAGNVVDELLSNQS